MIKGRLSESPLAYRLAKGAFWSVLGTMMSRILSLLISIVIARLLGKTSFGELGIVQGTFMMMGVLASFGMGMTATKYVAEYRWKDPVMTGNIVVLSSLLSLLASTIMALALIAVAPWLAARTLAAPHLSGLLRIGSGLLIFTAVNGAQTGALSGFEAFKSIAKINMLVSLISFPLMIVGVYINGLYGVVWALIITTAVNCILNHRALIAETKGIGASLNYRTCRAAWPLLWTFSIPAVIAGVMVSPVNWICSAILVNQPNGYAEMGIYNAANQWRVALMYLPGMLGNIVLPILSNLYGNDDKHDYRKMLWFNVRFSGGITMLAALIIATASPVIMRGYGADFEQGKSVLILMVLSAVMTAVGSVAGAAIISSGKIWLGVAYNLFWAIIIILCSYLLVPRYGALGIAIATGISYALQTLVQLYYLRSILR